MKKKTDKELADDLDARDRLRNRGYIQKRCPHCNGLGFTGSGMIPCYACDSRGFRWEAPIE